MDMISDNTFLIAALGIFLTILVLVQLFLATRHDHVTSAQGRLATLEALDTQIVAKRTTLQDLDDDLEKRRKALADVAGLGAEVDALTTKRDELLAEWNMLADKREEVRAIRTETEEAWAEKQRLDGDLQTAKAELEGVEGRLQRAEELVERIEALEARESELREIVGDLQDEARKLQDAETRVETLEGRERALLRDIAEAEGREAAAKARLEGTEADLAEERATLATIHGEVGDLRAQRASIQEAVDTAEMTVTALERKAERLETETAELDRITAQVAEARDALDEARQSRNTTQFQLGLVETSLSEKRDELEEITGRISAAKELLDRERRKMQGSEGVDDEASVEERLKELNTRPAVLEQLSNWAVWQPSMDREPEIEALDRVRERFDSSGLRYHPRILRAFHTSMKVNETSQMTVLAGISGTGKSQLPRQYAAGMGIGFLQVPVQPRWDSPQDLMGFFNYIEGRFRPTDLARALWQLDPLNNPEAIADRMMLVLLDEMNLARVEYYFSDFLSRLESRPSPADIADSNLRKDAEIELEIPMPRGVAAKRVFPGYNLLFTGTMNEDESTQSLSDKVVDRANVMRFGAPRRIEQSQRGDLDRSEAALTREQWAKWVRPTNIVASDRQVGEALERMRELMAGFKRPFGHRLGRAMMAYVANYPEDQGIDRERTALADQVEMRLLPKLRGVEVDLVETQFDDICSFVEQTLDDAELAQAIDDAVSAARDGSGQFVWSGVTRS